jgi:hypothetical protein
MRFVRHLLAVLAVVAVIMALGYAWKASPAASVVSDRRGTEPTNLPANAPASGFRADGPGRNLNGGFSLSRADDFAQSVVVLGLIVAGVVIVDRLRRRNGNPRVPAAATRTTGSSPPS